MKLQATMLSFTVLLAACSPAAPTDQQPAPAAASLPTVVAQSSGDAPPTVDGVFIQKGACPGEGCYLTGRIKAYEPVGLRAESRMGAAEVTQIAAGDWVDIAGTELRLIPARGTSRASGDVVYRLGYEGEGCSTVWTRGSLGSWCDDGDPSDDDIVWDAETESADPTLGFWVEVKLPDGRTGWLDEESLRKFGCTGYQDRDADCPPLQQ
ncbi:MAG TPA: hypothetical protein PLH23_10590 [Hyphomonadaceae bacterium]|nr:hypothetical protein [Hyphomonadaceae bacterium]HPI48706.1 hypothetical protein [Hyphomonadaceae bacterium]